MELNEEIGRGTYGIVYKYDRPGTVWEGSVLKRNLVEENVSFMGSIRELDILAQLKGHTNIVELTGISNTDQISIFKRDLDEEKKEGDDIKDDVIHFIFEKAETDMAHFMNHITPYYIKYFLYDILQGIKYIHDKNYIHRDIKPANLLIFKEDRDEITPKGRRYIKFCDFGLSKPLLNHKSYTPRLMTYWYRAPEVCFREPYDTKVDVWSIGLILYEMLSGKPLFLDLKIDDDSLLLKQMALLLPEECFKDLDKDHVWNTYGYKLGIPKYIFTAPCYRFRNTFVEEARIDLETVISIMITMLNVVPSKRPSPHMLLSHYIFNDIHPHHKSIENRIIKIHGNNTERIYIYNHIIKVVEGFKEKKDKYWYTPRIIFLTLSIADRYIDFKLSNGLKEHSEEGLVLRINIMIYISMKYMSTFLDCVSFKEFIDAGYLCDENLVFARDFEKVLVCNILNNKIYEMNLYEMFHPKSDEEIDIMITKLKEIDTFSGTVDQLAQKLGYSIV